MMDDIQKRGASIVMQTLHQLLGSLDILNEQKQQQLQGLQTELDRTKQENQALTTELAMLKAKLVVDAPS